jgi:hypothetical protein
MIANDRAYGHFVEDAAAMLNFRKWPVRDVGRDDPNGR